MSEKLLIPPPKRKRGSHLVTFLAIALFIHVMAFLWLSPHVSEFRHRGFSKMFAVRIVHLPPPPPPKPKPLPPLPKPKPTPARRASKVAQKAPPPLLKLHQVHFHVSMRGPKSGESADLIGTEETKGGSKYGNPEGMPGGTGAIVPPKPAPTVASPAPPPPAPKPPAGPTKDAQVLSQVQPTIPGDLQSEDYQSFVRVEVTINPDGTFTVKLLTSSGNAEVDRRVLEALNQWKWAPALKDGVAVRSVQIFKFEFQVE